MTASDTLCWNCDTSYPIADASCPKCQSANANVNPDKAQSEADGKQISGLLRDLSNLRGLVKQIQDALGTGEEGDNLVAVARDSHMAEMELAALRRGGE